MSDLVLAWHFVNESLRDGTPIPPDGEWLHYEGKCVMCESGLHASRQIIDALQYAPGSTVCRVACADIIEEQNDKFVCNSRFILWRLEKQDELLRAFARKAALSVIHLWNAPEGVRRYLETGDESIRAATRDATWDATWAATWDATWAAARAATWAAAWAAARAAAWAATRDAAWAAARAAARDAAWAAAWAATRDAAWAKLNADLEVMVLEARGNPDDAQLLAIVPRMTK